MVTARHNRIVKRLRDAGTVKKRWAIYADNQLIGSERLRPDLILIKNNEALVLDVACPFQNGPDTLDKAKADIWKFSSLTLKE